MSQTTITKKAYVRDGRLLLETPELADGEVIVHIEAAPTPSSDSARWFQQAQAKHGSEVLAMIDSGLIDVSTWKQLHEDSASWVERLRRSPRAED